MNSDRKVKTLFAETQLIRPDKTMILNKAKLLETIQDVGKEQSIAKLREAVFDFEKQFKDFKGDKKVLFNIGTDGDTIELSQRYLFNELNQVVEARTLERGRYYLQRLAKAISEYRTNKINDINLNRWKEYSDIITDSLWILDKRDSSGVHRADYWGNFIPQIPNQMIKRYTKKGECVLDTFAGCGTTLIECRGC